jgi:Icc-related predicted phosphoesterase
LTRLWIFSDPHFEMGNNIPASAPDHDVCVVAGDLNKLEWAVEQLASGELGNTGPTIYVPGNHDYYRTESMEGAERLATEKVKGTNVFLANPDEYVFNGTRFLGCTLWTDYKLYGDQMRSMGHAGSGMMDHRLIMTEDHSDYFVHTMPSTPFAYENRNRPPTAKRPPPPPVPFTAEHALRRHKRELAWLEERLKEPFLGPTVICSHHSPSPKSVPDRFDGDPLTPAFSSNLEWLIERYQPACWIHGHTHDSFDYNIGTTRVICNPSGYQHEPNPDFKWDLVVELDDHEPVAMPKM